MTMTFFSYPKFFLSGIWGSASLSKAEFLSWKPLLTSLLRFSIYVSLQMLLFIFFLFSRLCMRSHPDLHTPSHARSQAHTTHPSILSHNMRHAQPDSWPRPTRGERMVPCWGRFVGGDEPGSSALSPDIHTQMGPFTHMSDSVADWGRGTSRVAPSLVGGPQNCDGSWFISVHN